MSIGISYTSASGKSYGFSSSGGNESLARLREIEAQAARDVQARLAARRAQGLPAAGIGNDEYHAIKEAREAERQRKRESHQSRPHGGFTGSVKDALRGIADIAKRIVGFSSSLEEKSGKLQLKGDDRFVGAGYAFGKNGKGYKGFWSVADLLEAADARDEGRTVGSAEDTDGETPQSDVREPNGKTPFKLPYLTRVVPTRTEVRDPQTGEVIDTVKTLNVFVRYVSYTARGRAFAVSGETLLPTMPLPEGGGETAVDNVSIDRLTGDDALEIKGFRDDAAAQKTMLQIATESATDTESGEAVERYESGDANALRYRKYGRLESGGDSNITFTTTGGVTHINVYYL